ncbi:unnamed protein product, partial [Didymodactylos carnosus]
IAYIETSATDSPMNVDSAFQELVRIVRFEQNLNSTRISGILKGIVSGCHNGLGIFYLQSVYGIGL